MLSSGALLEAEAEAEAERLGSATAYQTALAELQRAVEVAEELEGQHLIETEPRRTCAAGEVAPEVVKTASRECLDSIGWLLLNLTGHWSTTQLAAEESILLEVALEQQKAVVAELIQLEVAVE